MDETPNDEKEDMFPVRIPRAVIKIMDEFLKKYKGELGILSRQELARRAIADWIREWKEKLEGR